MSLVVSTALATPFQKPSSCSSGALRCKALDRFISLMQNSEVSLSPSAEVACSDRTYGSDISRCASGMVFQSKDTETGWHHGGLAPWTANPRDLREVWRRHCRPLGKFSSNPTGLRSTSRGSFRHGPIQTPPALLLKTL